MPIRTKSSGGVDATSSQSWASMPFQKSVMTSFFSAIDPNYPSRWRTARATASSSLAFTTTVRTAASAAETSASTGSARFRETSTDAPRKAKGATTRSRTSGQCSPMPPVNTKASTPPRAPIMAPAAPTSRCTNTSIASVHRWSPASRAASTTRRSALTPARGTAVGRGRLRQGAVEAGVEHGDVRNGWSQHGPGGINGVDGMAVVDGGQLGNGLDGVLDRLVDEDRMVELGAAVHDAVADGADLGLRNGGRVQYSGDALGHVVAEVLQRDVRRPCRLDTVTGNIPVQPAGPDRGRPG